MTRAFFAFMFLSSINFSAAADQPKNWTDIVEPLAKVEENMTGVQHIKTPVSDTEIDVSYRAGLMQIKTILRQDGPTGQVLGYAHDEKQVFEAGEDGTVYLLALAQNLQIFNVFSEQPMFALKPEEKSQLISAGINTVNSLTTCRIHISHFSKD